MFPILLAALVWLFAKGKYAQYIALATTGNSSAPGAVTAPASSSASPSGASSGASSGSTSGLAALQGLFGAGSENSGAQSSSTPDDLIAGYTG